VNCETFVNSFYHSVTFRPRFCRSLGQNFYKNDVRNRQFGHYFSQNRGFLARGALFSLQKWSKIITKVRKTLLQCSPSLSSITLPSRILTGTRVACSQEYLILVSVLSRALYSHSTISNRRHREAFHTDYNRGGPF